MNLTNNARLKIKAKDLEVKSLNVSGSFPKATANAIMTVNDSEFVVFRNTVFENLEGAYNGIEIGLNSTTLPKNILFENCTFDGTFSNNCILVFGTQDNASITLSNCTFKNCSYPLRISNKTNVRCTINIVNCVCEKWDSRSPYQGFVICEDYTSGASESTNNLFGDNKITINFTHVTTPQGVLKAPENIASICGTGKDDQLIYVYYDVAGLQTYEATKYPIININ